MKTKRLFFLFLLTSLSTLAGAYDVEIEGIYYNLVEEAKTAEVTYKASSEASYSGNIVIPSSVMFYGVEYSVTSIGHSAFSGCTRLTSITLPCSVTHIGKWAFAFCSSLTDMYCLAEDVPTIDGNDIGLDIKYVTLHVPEASIDAYKSTAPWSGFDSIVILTPQTGIAINKENFPDKAFRQYLLDQDYGKDGILTQEEIAELKTIEICNIHINWTETSHSEDIPSYDIHDLKGIELLTALETLDLEYVPLTVLNLQGCKSLKQVRISE